MPSTAASPTAPVSRVHRPGWTADVAALCAYVALGLLVMAEFLSDTDGHLSAHLPIDNVWFEWLLAHGAYSVEHVANPLFSTRQNMPTGVNMMANTSVLGVTLPLAPLTLAFGPKTTYVIWIIAACAATAGATYWALSRHLVRSRAAAFLGGALAGFAPGVIHHANGQPNFVSNFLLPVIVVRVMRLGVTARWLRDGLILASLVTYQVFINEEMLLITAAACAVAVAAYSLQRRDEVRRRARSFAAAVGVTAGTAGALCAYPLWLQFRGPQSYRALPAFNSWGEDVTAYVTMSVDTIGGVSAAETAIGTTEQNSWFGWPLTAVAVAVAVVLWRRSMAARVGGVVAIVFAGAALGPHIRFNGRLTDVPGPWALIPDDTPVLAMLMPSRLSIAVVGVVVVLVALGWDHLSHRTSPPADESVHVLGRLLILAALLPLLPTPLPVMDSPAVPRFISSNAWRPYVSGGGTVVPVPLPDNGDGLSALGWSAAALHRFSVPNGYFLGPDQAGDGVFGPGEPTVTAQLLSYTGWTGEVPLVTADMIADTQRDLRFWQAEVVVLAHHRHEEALRSLLEQLLGPAQRDQDVWLWDVRRS